MLEIKKLLKNRNNRLMLVILIIGIVIIMFSTLFENKNDITSQSAENYMGEEDRLSAILSEIDGAGRVSVMISYESTDTRQSGIGRSISATESLSKPRGVIVVADGASTPTVRNSLKEAAVAITGVGANRVCVYGR